MNKLEELRERISVVPQGIYRGRALLVLESGNLSALKAYTLGAYHMALELTSDEHTLDALAKVAEGLS